MADLKLMLLVNLRVSGQETLPAGTIYEGTLDTFPEAVRQEYIEKNWKNIRVINDAKGRAVSPTIQKGPIAKGAKVEPLQGKTPKDESEGYVPSSITPPTSVFQSPSEVTLEYTDTKAEEKASDDKQQSGATTFSSDDNAERVQRTNDESDSGPDDSDEDDSDSDSDEPVAKKPVVKKKIVKKSKIVKGAKKE